MRTQLTVILLALALLTLQCSDAGKSVKPDNPTGPDPIGDRTVKQLTTSEKALAQSVNRFSFKLLQRIDKATEPGKNVFISPLSVSYALGMATNGANGQTRSEMESALELSGFTLDEANQAYYGLTAILTKTDPAVTFTIANSFWSRQGKAIQPKFITACQDYFNARVETIDFQSADAADRINGWVSDNTAGKITKIVEPPLDPSTAAILLNALYFKANWSFPFDTEWTFDSPFYLSNGTQSTCKMMTKDTEGDEQLYPDAYPKRPLTYFQNNACKGLELPYGNQGFRMTVLLPDSTMSADSLIALLTPESWASWRQTRVAERLFLGLPKFKMEFSTRLNDILQAMGMNAAFAPGTADFSGLFVDGVGWISEVKHKTFVQVDEKGTEAAAVTSVGYEDSLPPELYANRPFVFIIHELESGTILFMGKIEDPKWE